MSSDTTHTLAALTVGPRVTATERVLVALPDGRWLALDRPAFEAALIAGNATVTTSAQTSHETTPEPLVDAERAAVQLGVTARWLEDCARAGIVPHHRFGRFIRFRVSEVAAHFRVEGATPA